MTVRMLSEQETLRLHPEIIEHGSLCKAILAVAPALCGRLRGFEEDGGSIFWADARIGRRVASNVCASEKRLFMCNLSENGIILAATSSGHLPDVAAANEAWMVRGVSLGELTSLCPLVRLQPGAVEYEEGPERYVSFRWRELITFVGEHIPELEPVVKAASQNPRLAQLLPFTSLNRLSFSRSIDYSYPADCPLIQPIGTNHYEVYDGSGSLVGVGDADRAVSLALKVLPSECGPGVEGTAEDIA